MARLFDAADLSSLPLFVSLSEKAVESQVVGIRRQYPSTSGWFQNREEGSEVCLDNGGKQDG